MVTRFGIWPNRAPNTLPHRQIFSSGNQTTIESVVSPPGVAINSRVRSPTVRVRVSSTTMSAVGVLWPGNFLPNRSWILAMPAASVSAKANALREDR